MFIDYLESLPSTVLTESVKAIYKVLTESIDGDAGNYFRKFIRTLPPNVVRSIQADVLQVMEEECPDEPKENWIPWLWNWFRGDFELRNSDAIYYAPGLARIVFGDEIEKFDYFPKNPLNYYAAQLCKIVHYIAMAHKGEYTRFLVDKATGEPATYATLKDKFGAALKNTAKIARDELAKMKYTPSDYVVEELASFEDTKKFEPYTASHKWCYFEDKSTFDYYRSGGSIRLYIAYKPGFTKLKPGDPGYGQSMLGIDIGPGGELVHCSNRYNHDDDPELDNEKNRPGDNRFNAKELSLLLGGPYYQFCPYYSKEERSKRGIVEPEDIIEDLANGEDISIYISGESRGIGDDQILYFRNGRFNVLRPDHTLLYNEPSDWPTDIDVIQFKGEQRYLIWWQDRANVYDRQGNALLPDGLDMVRPDGDRLWLKQGELINIMDSNGQLVYPEWLMEKPLYLCKTRVLIKPKDGMYRLVDQNMKPVSDVRMAEVKKMDGWPILSEDQDDLPPYYEYIEVVLNAKTDEHNILRPSDGKLMLNPSYVDDLVVKYGDIRCKEVIGAGSSKINLLYLDNPSFYVFDEWYDSMHKLTDDIAILGLKQKDGTSKYKLFNIGENEYVLNEFVDSIRDSRDLPDNEFFEGKTGYLVFAGDYVMMIDGNGNALWSNWKNQNDWQ